MRRSEHGIPPDWGGIKACQGLDPNLFVVNHTNLEDVERAKAICRKCSVRPECHAFADTFTSMGVWGGQVRHLGKVVPKRPVVGRPPKEGHAQWTEVPLSREVLP